MESGDRARSRLHGPLTGVPVTCDHPRRVQTTSGVRLNTAVVSHGVNDDGCARVGVISHYYLAAPHSVATEKPVVVREYCILTSVIYRRFSDATVT